MKVTLELQELSKGARRILAEEIKDQEALLELADDSEYLVRCAAGRNPNASERQLVEKTAKDNDHIVRMSAIGNPSSSRAIVEQLLDDPCERVREYARQILQTRDFK